MSFVRVSKKLPCPICGHDKWCTIWNGGKSVCCPRTAIGANEEYKSAFGYVHTLTEPVDVSDPIRNEATPMDIDWEGLAGYYQEQYESASYPLPKLFGSDREKVRACSSFGVGWDGRTYTIPMWLEGECCGIQRRFPDGSKVSVPGSRVGLFVPTTDSSKVKTLYITEGVSDAISFLAYVSQAAVLGRLLNTYVIGRQNCDMTEEVVSFHAHLNPEEVVIFADHDAPGMFGARVLRNAFERNTYSPRIFLPRDKDVRETLTKRGQLEGRWQ